MRARPVEVPGSMKVSLITNRLVCNLQIGKRVSYTHRMPRTGLSAAEIKKKAIDATMVRMREEGFDKVKLTDIAKELGVSHAALYAHFEDKAALLDAVSEHWLLDVDATLDAVCRKAGDPSEKITAWMLAFHRAKVAKIVRDPE